MSQIIDVSTWVALIAGIAGIVLSIVAIWFAFAVDRRSRNVTEQMIKSLQKIESGVDRTSTDTQGLIKVAWERMLGGVGGGISPESDQGSESAIKQVAEGLAEEVRADLRTEQEGGTSPSIDEDRIAEQVSETILAQLRLGRQARPKSAEGVEKWISILSRLSPTAYELAGFLGSAGHLNRTEYMSTATNSKYAKAVQELRRAGVIVPLLGGNESKDNQPSYWFPPDSVENIRIAHELISREYPRQSREISRDLGDVGYNNRHRSTLGDSLDPSGRPSSPGTGSAESN